MNRLLHCVLVAGLLLVLHSGALANDEYTVNFDVKGVDGVFSVEWAGPYGKPQAQTATMPCSIKWPAGLTLIVMSPNTSNSGEQMRNIRVVRTVTSSGRRLEGDQKIMIFAVDSDMTITFELEGSSSAPTAAPTESKPMPPPSTTNAEEDQRQSEAQRERNDEAERQAKEAQRKVDDERKQYDEGVRQHMDQIAIGLQGGPDTSGVVHAARKELGAIFFGVAGALVAGLIVMGFVSIGLMSSVAVPPVGIVLAAGFLAGALAGAIFL